MTTKLTLTVDKETIERAKRYAKDQGRSLSNIVENYLKMLSKEKRSKESKSPIADSMYGAFSAPDNFDYKKELQDALAKKYLK